MPQVAPAQQQDMDADNSRISSDHADALTIREQKQQIKQMKMKPGASFRSG